MAEEHEARAGPALQAELLELLDVVDDDRVPVDVKPVHAGDLPHPLAAVRRPDPRARSTPRASRPRVPQWRNTSWLVCAPRLAE
jgi:hypothetical protein